MLTSNILNLFLCPDCSGKLISEAGNIKCKSCKRDVYSKGNYIDLLPSKPLKITNPYSKKALLYYLSQYKFSPSTKFKNFDVWGVYENSSRDYKVFLNQERKVFEKYYSKNKRVFCDISAASGYFTLRASRLFKIILHMDINLEYLQYAQKQAKKKGLNNLFFVRADYFKLPLKERVIDTMICTDSLEYYGLKNDLKIIKKANEKLNRNGCFIFDLHHKKFYFPDKHIFEYGKNEIECLKKEFPNVGIVPFGRVPTRFHPNNFLFKVFSKLGFLPPIRNIAVIKK